MAVEIPVVIDIDKAFKDAADRVDSAMKPLENKINSASEKLKFRVGFDEEGQARMKNISELIDVIEKKQGRGTRKYVASLQEINNAIAYTEEQLTRLYAIEESGSLSRKESKELQGYREALILLTAIKEQRHHNVDLIEEETNKAINAKRAEEARLATISKSATTMAEMNEKMSALQGQLQNTVPGSPEWIALLKTIQEVGVGIENVNKQIRAMGQSAGSLDSLNERMRDLQQRYSSMAATELYDAKGPTEELRRMQVEYADLSEAIEKSSNALNEERDKRQKAADAAAKQAKEMERLNQLVKKSTTQRRYENAVLKMNGDSMRVLQEQERILSERLNKAKFGTKQFEDLATKLREVRVAMENAKKSIDGQTNSMNKAGSAANKARVSFDNMNVSMKKQSSLFSQLKSLAAMYFSVLGGIRFMRNIRDTTAELELQRVALGGILQDTDKAAELFRQIKAAALKSPFEIKDLVTYTKQLSAYRIETDKLFDVTMRLADVSAGLGVDMNRLILAYGQVRAAAVLRGQELRQFTEAGIPLVELLAEKFRKLGREGTTTADVFELISKRAVSFSMIEEIFNEMTDAGGIFYKMQEKQAETLKGKWMKLKDAITIMYDEIGNTGAVRSAMEDFIDLSLRLTRSWEKVARWVGSGSAAVVAYTAVSKSAAVATTSLTMAEAKRYAITKKQTVAMPALIAKIIGETKAKKANEWTTKRLTMAQVRLAAANTTLSKTFWRLTVAILSNPYAAAAAAVVALGASIYTLVKNSEKAKFTLDGFEASIEKFKGADSKAKDIDKLISAYEELSQKTDITADEQERLNRISKELAKTFPQVVAGIDSETGALQINLDKVRELSEAELNLHKQRLENDIKSAEIEEGRIKNRLAQIDKLLEQGGKEQKVYGGTQILPLSKKEVEELDDEVLQLKEDLDRVQKDEQAARDALAGINEEAGSKTTTVLSIWKQKIADIQKEKHEAGAIEIFSSDEIEKFESVAKFSKVLKQKFDEYTQSLKTNRELLKSATAETRESIQADIDADEQTIKMINAITSALGILFKQSSPKDNRLSILKKEISDITSAYKKFKELREYKGEAAALVDMESLFPQLDGWEPTFDGMISKLKEKLENVRKQLKKTPKSQTLIDMERELLNAISNAEFDKFKETVEKQLNRVSDELKQSAAARDFFKNIFDLTGDKELAASLSLSVYGDTGAEFRDRIQRQLDEALSAVSTENLSNSLEYAIKKQDFSYLLANIDKFESKWRSVIINAANETQSYNAKIASDYSKLLMKYDEIEQERVDITNKAARDIATIEDGLRLEIKGILKNEEIDNKKFAIEQAQARAAAAKKAVVNQRDIDLSRLEGDYRLFFSSVNILSENTARDIASKQKKMLTDQFVQGRISLSKYKREIKEINGILEKYGKRKFMFQTEGLSGLIEGMKQVSDDFLALASTVKTNGGIWTPTEDAKQFLKQWGGLSKTGGIWNIFSGEEKISKVQQDAERASKNAYWYTYNTTKFLEKKSDSQAKMEAEAAATAAVAEVMTNASDDMAAAAASFESGLAEFEQIFYAIDSMFKFMDREMQRDKKYYGSRMVNYGYALDEALVGSNKKIASSYEAFKKGDIFGAFADLGDAFYQFINPTEEWNNKIKNQEFLIKDLDYQYGRFEKSIKKSFGSDYISDYNKQLETLYAKQAAYQAQADAERGKEKERDADKIEEYENQAREVADQIVDMQHQLAEFFTGTDLTSAAKDFATAWIDAYKEFGSTTDAMREKFNEMLQEMVTNSLAAKVMQTILQPLFDQIDEMSKDGELSANEIAAIATASPAYIEQINNAMTALMNELTAAGYNLRQQPGQFTGIKRNIANATEESVNGLTQAMNVNNFYMSHIPGLAANVASILAIISGGTAEDVTTGASYQLNNELALQYLSSLPNIDQNIAEILRYVKSVISDKNSASNINVVAVRA